MGNEMQTTQPARQMTLAEARDKILTDVDKSIREKTKSGLVLPKNYVPFNALQAAMLTIQQTLDKDKKPALSVCTQESVKQSLLEMLQQGLNPSKKQGYFIVFGNRLVFLTSYFGEIAKAKYADPNIDEIYGEVVYDKDEFEYAIKHGYKEIRLHVQKPENIDLTKIKGAYATILYKDGHEVSEYMTKAQIENSWSKGQTRGKSDAHILSPEEMSKKTVLRRLCKSVYNTSDDTEIMPDEAAQIDQEIDQQQNQQTIDITPPDMLQLSAENTSDVRADEDGVIQEPEKDPTQPAEFPS